MITQIDPNLKYQKDNFIKYDDFFYPGIYTKTYDYYYGNDLIFGNIKGVDLRFSDIFVKKEEIIYDSDGHAQKRIINIFSGIFFIADFNKNFTSKTIIIDEKSKYANISMQKANMDNFEFEKKFNVYTNDQINARYILSPVFMEQFTKIRNSFNCPVNACFLDNKIYIYIERGFDSFEADLKKSLVGENSSIQHYKLEVLKFIDLVVNLKLNNTIFKF